MADLKYDNETTALIVIDPYNDFISEGGHHPAHTSDTTSTSRL